MATLPPNGEWRGDDSSVRRIPDAKRILAGEKFDGFRLGPNRCYTHRYVAVYGRIINGSLVFCVETVRQIVDWPGHGRDRWDAKNEWCTKSRYTTKHAHFLEDLDKMWSEYTSIFNADDTLKMDVVRALCAA